MHTKKQFTAYEKAYDYFNRKLFKNELPPVLLNFSRKNKAMGFAVRNNWTSKSKDGNKDLCEISINPDILHMGPIDIYSTLVHEMCHIWQYVAGKPSRGNYHNREWANKMLEVGLTPSDTGAKGGKMTGQGMSDYPTPDGVFLAALDKMPKSCEFPLMARPISRPRAAAKKKVCYKCSTCETKVWGKPNLNISCGDCEEKLETI